MPFKGVWGESMSIFRFWAGDRRSLCAPERVWVIRVSTVIPMAPSFLLLCIGMAATSDYNTQISADGYSQRHDHHRPPSPSASLSPTLVNTGNTHHTARPSLKLKIPGGATSILNSRVVDTAGQSLYLISSDSKRTTLVSCRDNVEFATVQWDRHSPRMVFHRKKMKCKEWLKLTGPDNEYIPTPRFTP